MSTTARRGLIAGFLFFLIAKLATAIVPAFVMGMPRIGDDSLVYLWLGESTVFAPHDDTPGVNSIRGLYERDDHPSEEVAYQRARASIHVTSVVASPYSAVTLLLLRTGLEHTIVWSILEALVVIVLAYGIARFLHAVFGPRAAALGLVLLSFLILPEQGLHYFIPGVLALAVALIAWARAIEGKADWRQTLLCVVLCLIHPISFAYAAMAAALAFLVPMAREKRLSFDWRAPNWRAPVWTLAGAAGAIALSILLGAKRAQSDIAESISPRYLGENAWAALNFFFDAIEDAPFLTLAVIAGTIIGLRRGQLTWVTGTVALILIGALLVTPLIDIRTYPGALGARVQVSVIIFASGIAALPVLALIESTGRVRIAGWALVALVTLSLVPAAWKAMVRNINQRYDILDSHDIRRTLAALPPNEPIVWLEADTIMMAAFIEGAWSRPAYPYPALGAAAGDLLADRKSILLATRIPLPLNSRAAMSDRTLRPRFNGFSFADVSEVRVTQDSAPLQPLHVRLEGAAAPVEATLMLAGADCGAGRFVETTGAWRELDVSACPESDAVRLTAPALETRITGLARTEPRAGADWPWGAEGLSITATPRRYAPIPLHLQFGLSDLLTEAGAGPLLPRLGHLQLISDRGGMVMLRADVR